MRELFKRMVARVCSESLLTRIMFAAGKAAGLKKGRHFTHHSRPLRAADSAAWNDPIQRDYRIAIVVQGPLALKDNLTAETLKCYTAIFPHAEIILSTWEGEDIRGMRNDIPSRVHVIQSGKPKVPGVLNLNFQLRSSLAGVKKAKELGADYVLKTRTDTRIHNPVACDFLVGLTKAFPLDPKLGSIQKYRIVSTDHTRKFIPYFLSDQLVFGHVDDMMLFWSAPEDARESIPGSDDPTVRKEYLDRRVPEIHLVTSFLSLLGIKPEWTLADGWRVYANHFCIADCAMLDFVWYKYASHFEYPQRRGERKTVLDPLTFAEWLILAQSLDQKTIPSARLLDENVFATIPRDIFNP